jgi:hypothetical protein
VAVVILSVLAFFRDRDKRYAIGAVAVLVLLAPIVLGVWMLVTGWTPAGGG